jgi:hypothetical protein
MQRALDSVATGRQFGIVPCNMPILRLKIEGVTVSSYPSCDTVSHWLRSTVRASLRPFYCQACTQLERLPVSTIYCWNAKINSTKSGLAYAMFKLGDHHSRFIDTGLCSFLNTNPPLRIFLLLEKHYIGVCNKLQALSLTISSCNGRQG